MKKILFLTNKDNGVFDEEDSGLIKFLSSDFDFVVSHPLDCLPLLHTVEGVIIRNIWPTHEYLEDWKEIRQKIIDSKLPTYSPLIGKGDNMGKDYLVELYKKGYPVIPSVDRLKDIEKLGDVTTYRIKPKEGCDGFGSGKYTRDELRGKNLTDYVIQPCIEFVAEPSFFFIGDIFSHAITTTNRLLDQGVELYAPTDEELLFAKRFIDWNNLRAGIQRIDAVRLADGSLLLTEVEDIAPYLYINDLDENAKQNFLEKIKTSLLRFFS